MFAILLAAAVAAADPAQPPATPTTTVSPVAVTSGPTANGEKLVCWMEAPSGSHQKERICATQAQLDRSRRNAQDYMTQKKFELNKGLVGN
ncbi:MAG: hypothetical protein JWP49_362 [Phenylobacterium sp.]|nr:hypothetical protein [Phenylobacterium sp.]